MRTVDAVGRGIEDPVLKLRFLRTSLKNYRRRDEVIGRVPWPSLRRFLYQWFTVGGLQRLLRNPLAVSLPVRGRARRSLRLAQGALVLTAASVAATAGGLTLFAMRLFRAEEAPVMAADAAPAPPAAAVVPVAAGTTEPEPGGPPETLGQRPAGIWQVEKGDGWELYSNGLRIETGYAVLGDKRRYRVFDQDVLSPETFDRPVGILFHTSESDVWPLEPGFNENLRGSTHRLLRYLAREKTYHYLIDRFGRVYRVVEDEAKANHAGHSVWQDEGRVYLNLNHAFLGVSFETRWEGGRALPITEAQFGSGKNLTAWLRQRWDIAPSMCVAHGLTSVNPRRHLIGHHLDWARGFPFASFGLPDAYSRPAPSVALFGFGYDSDFLKVLGEPWSGVFHAERALESEAARLGRSADDLRRDKRALYDRWLQEQARVDDSPRVPTLGG